MPHVPGQDTPDPSPNPSPTPDWVPEDTTTAPINFAPNQQGTGTGTTMPSGEGVLGLGLAAGGASLLSRLGNVGKGIGSAVSAPGTLLPNAIIQNGWAPDITNESSQTGSGPNEARRRRELRGAGVAGTMSVTVNNDIGPTQKETQQMVEQEVKRLEERLRRNLKGP